MSSPNPSYFRKSLFNKNDFTITFELVPSRGGWSKGQSRLIDFARKAAADSRIKAVSLTENAGGHPALSPEVIGIEIKAMGLDVINHFSCKDKNRNQMESLLFAWDRVGLNNLLIITGDYPQKGYLGKPKPVFDLDSVQVNDLISRMNHGIIETARSRNSLKFKPTSFLKGVALSPFKKLRPELALQYAKLRRKIHAGADYIITQLGYDARKFHEVLLYMQENKFNIPVLGNVFIPNLAVAKMMHKGMIPGCIISEQHLQDILKEEKSPGQGKKASLVRGAKLMAILKGIGYDGAHIGGPGLTFSDLDFLITESENFSANWHDFIQELSYWPYQDNFLYAFDPETGLNLPNKNTVSQKKRKIAKTHYQISDFIHRQSFTPEGKLFSNSKKLCLAMEEKGHEHLLMQVEHLIKFILFKCKNCGDCRLADLAYICPQSGCAKYMLNGPCGGSNDGWCEVYPGKKKCFYVKLYERLDSCNKLSGLLDRFQPPRDWAADNTSSWLNFFKNHDKL